MDKGHGAYASANGNNGKGCPTPTWLPHLVLQFPMPLIYFTNYIAHVWLLSSSYSNFQGQFMKDPNQGTRQRNTIALQSFYEGCF